jgi:hypothetical protein
LLGYFNQIHFVFSFYGFILTIISIYYYSAVRPCQTPNAIARGLL